MSRRPRPYCPTHDCHGDPDMDGLTWFVYTCLATDGTPLYVGLTGDPVERLLWHAKYSGSGEWYYHTSRVEVGGAFSCKYVAHAHEVAEIQRLRPAFNKHHNPNPQPWSPSGPFVLRFGEIPPLSWLHGERAA